MLTSFLRFTCVIILFCSCNHENNTADNTSYIDTAVPDKIMTDSSTAAGFPEAIVHPQRDSLVDFAESLIGVPYKYGSTDPAIGFDCSGFITYVFNHFHIKVPRSSIDFTNVGREVKRENAKRGDLILFTGTDSLETFVGHMGIVTENRDTLKFIHSTSGKQYGVTITPLNTYYQGRFVKVIDIL